MIPERVAWYGHRLSRMSVPEVGARIGDAVRRQTWRRYRLSPLRPDAGAPGRSPAFDAWGPGRDLPSFDPGGARAVRAAADRIRSGRWQVLGATRHDLQDPDWFLDPVTGRRAPAFEYCFSIDHRDETVTGNVKQVWELSRLQHVTVLASAYAVSGDEGYAEQAAGQLRSWWAANPFLSGVHWTSGIEVGLRLISMAWTRRLLDRWAGSPTLFEHDEAARRQIRAHQLYLAGFRSRGSSANNHVIAEAAGQLVASLAFPWFDESEGWARDSATLLEAELAKNTGPSGLNREMAFEYHGFVAELGLVAAAEAERAGRPLGRATWTLLCRMLDALAAVVDETGRPPRYGDGDGGRGYLLGDPGEDRWASLLAAGRLVFGALPWWPECPPSLPASLIGALAGRHTVGGRPAERPDRFPDAGLTLLRSQPGSGPEIWCRCDGGPHGFLSIAAHAHADALSVEVRHGGTEILSDPGTYCYHGDPEWRRYFRSTVAHNTVEVGGRDQSLSGGPFLWTRHARTTELGPAPDGKWSAGHDGYAGLEPPAEVRRTVTLDAGLGRLEIADLIRTDGTHPLRVAFHLGPEVHAVLGAGCVELTWDGRRGACRGSILLPDGLSWSLHRGEDDPPLGWYSAEFGQKQPSTTLIGTGRCLVGVTSLTTVVCLA